MRRQLLLSAIILYSLLLIHISPVHAQNSEPSTPSGPHYWCTDGQTGVRLSWYPTANTTEYSVNIDVDAPSWNGTCTLPDLCLTTKTNEITIPIKPLVPYDWSVYAHNATGKSKVAMDGLIFSCKLPVPVGLHYRCASNESAQLNWVPVSDTLKYDIFVDESPISSTPSCIAPDRCFTSETNKFTVPVSPGVAYEYRVQTKDASDNKSLLSDSLYFGCNLSGMPVTTVTPAPSLTPIPTINTGAPTISPSPSPNPTRPYCELRSKGDANCNATINMDDYLCWKEGFVRNRLDTVKGCAFTDFDLRDGTTLLDFAIWHAQLQR